MKATTRKNARTVVLGVTAICFALSPTARAVTPPPDGGYPGRNTAVGDEALFSLTTGVDNTAIGHIALLNNITGNNNTATGSLALRTNRTGSDNTANGAFALLTNNGSSNTANGVNALRSNTTGDNNTATGTSALLNNTTGTQNTATGAFALFLNTTGSFNMATGLGALRSNTTGSSNTADGTNALLNNTTGTLNIALGDRAGINLTTGSNNIHIGNLGSAGQSRQIRIGTQGTQRSTFIAGIRGVTVPGGVGVVVDANGRLGTATSSARFKEEIKAMDKASEAILALKPVTFRYKHDLDPEGIPQFGLVAEQVEKVNPDLVARDEQGKAYTVRYEAVNAMLLNEFLKEHRKVEEQEETITQVKSTVAKQEATIAQQQKEFQSIVAQQQKEIKVLTASLEAQASQIKKVSERLDVSRPAPQLVVNNR